MVAQNDDQGVLVETLLPAPLDESSYLSVCALYHRCGGFAILLRIAFIADVAQGEMGIGSQHGEIEGFAAVRQRQELLLGDFVEDLVLKAPPDLVILRDPAGFLGSIIVVNTVIPVSRKISSSAAEGRIGSA